jgi:hypothetical protein
MTVLMAIGRTELEEASTDEEASGDSEVCVGAGGSVRLMVMWPEASGGAVVKPPPDATLELKAREVAVVAVAGFAVRVSSPKIPLPVGGGSGAWRRATRWFLRGSKPIIKEGKGEKERLRVINSAWGGRKVKD